MDKLRHAYLSMCFVLGVTKMTPETWLVALAEAERIQRRIAEQVYLSRKKDYDNSFRMTTCRNKEEAMAVFGELEENSFIKQVREEAYTNIARIERMRR